MKKIMLFVLGAVLAVGAQSATVSWNIVNVKDSTGAALSGGSVYLFMVDGSSADTSWVAGLAGKGAAAVSTAMADAKLTYTMDASVAAGNYSYNVANGFTLPTNEAMGMSPMTTYTLYAVLFDSETITDDSKFYVTAARSMTTLDNTSTANRMWSLTATTSGTASNWNAVGVPEPTSGLLLLVGGALLALRRKQK